jgi:hypothetical protein
VEKLRGSSEISRQQGINGVLQHSWSIASIFAYALRFSISDSTEKRI